MSAVTTIIDTPGARTYRVGVYRRRFPRGHRWHGWLSKMYGARTMHESVHTWPGVYPYYLRESAYDEAMAPARKAYDEAGATAHHLVCSVDGCPFDGRTIFPTDKAAR